MVDVDNTVSCVTTTQMCIGGDYSGANAAHRLHKAVVRADNPSRNSADSYRSGWSWQDYYKTGADTNDFGKLKMRHLQSNMRVQVVETGNYNVKGARDNAQNLDNSFDNPEVDGYDKAELASEQWFTATFSRFQTPKWTLTGEIGDSAYDRFSYRHGNMGDYEDSFDSGHFFDFYNGDWKLVSFADEVVVRDIMPVCRPDANSIYYGFLSNGIELSAASGSFMPYVDHIDIYIDDYTVDQSGAPTGVSSLPVTTLSAADLNIPAALSAGMPVKVCFNHANQKLHQSVKPTDPFTYDLKMGANQFVTRVEIVLKNIPGSADYSAETGWGYTKYDSMPRNTSTSDNGIDMRVYGRPYVWTLSGNAAHNAQTKQDATNTIETFSRRFYAPGTDVINRSLNRGSNSSSKRDNDHWRESERISAAIPFPSPIIST